MGWSCKCFSFLQHNKRVMARNNKRKNVLKWLCFKRAGEGWGLCCSRIIKPRAGFEVILMTLLLLITVI